MDKIKKEFNNISTPNELLQFMSKYIGYGYFGVEYFLGHEILHNVI